MGPDSIATKALPGMPKLYKLLFVSELLGAARTANCKLKGYLLHIDGNVCDSNVPEMTLTVGRNDTVNKTQIVTMARIS